METNGDECVQIDKKFSEKLGLPNLTKVLAETPLRYLNPIMVKAWRDRATMRNAKDLLNEYESKGQFYGACSVDQRELNKLESAFYLVVPHQFKAVEISPISPFGLNSVITKVSQDISLSTIRGSEVISDPTTALALECAAIRKKALINKETRDNLINLATTQRVLRLQPFDSEKGYTQHFRLFGLCSSGRDKRGKNFLVDSIIEHISIWLDLVAHLKSIGYYFNDICVKISDIRVLEHLIATLSLPRAEINKNSFNEDFDFFKKYGIDFPREVAFLQEINTSILKEYKLQDKMPCLVSVEQKILLPLREKYPKVRFCFDFARKAGLGYYQHICYHLFASTRTGRCIPLADGGSVDWLEKLLFSKKERALTSGFGAELVQKLFSQET